MKSPALEEISMYHRQQGITAIGFIILAAFIGLFILAGVKLAPVYLEGMDVKSALTKAKTELDGNRPSIVDIRDAIRAPFRRGQRATDFGQGHKDHPQRRGLSGRCFL